MGNKNGRMDLNASVASSVSNERSQSGGSKSNLPSQRQAQPFFPQQDEQKEIDFKIYIGIDFGTDGCGLAYAFRNSPNNIHHQDDDEEEENKLSIDNDYRKKKDGTEYVEIHKGFKDAFGPYDKSRTSVLMDADNRPQCVGGEAANTFVQMQNKQNWKLFERFKMSLYEDPDWREEVLDRKGDRDINKVDLKEMIIPSVAEGDLTPIPSKQVFIAELQKLKKVAFQYLKQLFQTKRELKFDYTEEEIQWILTVPAIWNEPAKGKMKLWAYEAELIDIRVKDQLKIVYEPDCASLSVQYTCNKWGKSKQSINKPPIEYKPSNDGGGLIQFDDSDDEDFDYGLIDTTQKYEKNKIDDNDNKDNLILNEDDIKYTSKGFTATLEKQVIILRDDKDPGIRFNKNDIYVLVDAGGGTVDIACHRIMDEYAIEEILHPTGGKWGSLNIDEQFKLLLDKIFGKDKMNKFKKKDSGMWLQLCNNFCNDAKASFYNSYNHDKKYHHITLPSNFSTFIIDNYDDDIDKVNELLSRKSLQLFNEDDLLKWEVGKWGGASLQLHNKVFINELFEPKTVKPIINHLSKILENELLINCKYIILVGGLSNSRYYQQRIYNTFGKSGGIKILIPDKPQLCVVEGAARYGIKPNYIQIRMLSSTYGIRIDYAKESLPSINKYDPDWLQENTYKCNETHREYVKNIFSVFVRKDNAIKFNDKPFIQTYFRRHAKQKTIDIKIYKSKLSKPLHVLQNECEALGEIQLLFNTNKNNQTSELEITVEFWFNDTTLKVFAYPKGHENMKREYQVNYL